MSVEYICWYWIYQSNGRIVGVSVRPSGTLLGNINLLKYKFVLNICCQQFGGYKLLTILRVFICKLNVYVSVG